MPGLHASFLGLFALFILAVGALGIVLVGRSRGRAAGSRVPLRVALFASLAAIFAITLVPAHGPNDLQLVPLIRIIRGFTPPVDPTVVTNVVGNILLFLPLGAALRLLGLRPGATVRAGFCLSAAIEITQLFIPGRTTAADDVLCNTAGALVGCLLVSRWAAGRRADPTG
jgi:glycopeptide antibiotics resistance protein